MRGYIIRPLEGRPYGIHPHHTRVSTVHLSIIHIWLNTFIMQIDLGVYAVLQLCSVTHSQQSVFTIDLSFGMLVNGIMIANYRALHNQA